MIPCANPNRSSNSDVGSQSIGQLVGQMVDKELSKLQEALASEKTMREAAEGKLRDASLSLESREGDFVMLEKVFCLTL